MVGAGPGIFATELSDVYFDVFRQSGRPNEMKAVYLLLLSKMDDSHGASRRIVNDKSYNTICLTDSMLQFVQRFGRKPGRIEKPVAVCTLLFDTNGNSWNIRAKKRYKVQLLIWNKRLLSKPLHLVQQL